MAATNAARRTEEPLTIDLYGEAKDTAQWIANRYNVSPGDVVARALGLLYFIALQERDGRRVITENGAGGDRRPININLRAGDAGSRRIR